jgi:OmcA/MtrC family decaheme c-type cytochrome
MTSTKHNIGPFRLPGLATIMAALALFVLGCAQPMPEKGDPGADGKDGADGISCTIEIDEDENRSLICDDGTEVALTDGADGLHGTDGTSCTAFDNGDGTKTIACEDNTQVVVYDGGVCEVTHREDNGDGTETLDCVGDYQIRVAIRVPIDPCAMDILESGWQTESPAVLGVCPNSRVVVFTTFENGTPRTAGPGEANFSMAKLVPGENGPPDAWQSYINTGTEGDASNPIRATRDSSGNLTAYAPGIYVYTFGNDVQSISSPIAVPYEPSLTHRVAIEFRGAIAALGGAGNLYYDWRPDGEAIDREKRIATTNSCAGCHKPLNKHGNRSNDVEACVVCHNPGSTNRNTGNTIDLGTIVHKIHSGKNLPSVQAGIPYQLQGHGGLYDYSAVSYPQDIRNCMKCHTDSPATPQGDKWKSASLQGCMSCHNDLTFADQVSDPTWQKVHTPGHVVSTQDCTGCHSETGLRGADRAHRTLVSTPNNPNTACRTVDGWSCVEDFPVFEFDIISVAQLGDPATEATEITAHFAFRADDTPLDLNNLPAGVEFLNTTMRLIWANAAMYGTITDVSSLLIPADFNHNSFENRNLAWLQANAVRDIDDGTYTVTLGTVPVAATNVSVAIEGRAEVDGEIVTVAAGFKGVGIDKTPRRQIVSTEQCLACHERLDNYGHGGSSGNHTSTRVDSVDYCAVCHNPTRTNNAHRPTSMAYMTHRIHTGRHEGRPDKAYPGNLADCTTCHLPETYELPLPGNALAMSLRRDFSERVSPTGGACIACHDSPTARIHAHAAESTGAFSAAGDACVVCHGPGRSYDVRKVHNLP